MARSFHRRRTLAPLSELNVTSLIDLGFSLLIIFMISTPLIQNERTIPVDLPLSTESVNRASEEKVVDIVIVTAGYSVDGTLMSRAQLETLLKGHAASRRPPTVAIRADRNIAYQEVVTLLDLLKLNNMTKVSLDTQSR